MFAEGTVFPLVVLLIIAISVIATISASRQGRNFELRKLPAVDALDEAVGRAVEMGRPVHWCSGTGRGRSLTRVAGASAASYLILEKLAHLCARLGAKLLPSIGQPEAISIVDAICNQAYYAEGLAGEWNSENVAFYPDKAYKIGVPSRLSTEKVKANIMVGTFVSEAIIIAEAGANVGAFQIGGTTAWNNIAYFVTSCDYFLIGEEIYAAGAYLSKDPTESASLVGQDISKLIFIALILVGTIMVSLGSDILTNLLKM